MFSGNNIKFSTIIDMDYNLRYQHACFNPEVEVHTYMALIMKLINSKKSF